MSPRPTALLPALMLSFAAVVHAAPERPPLRPAPAPIEAAIPADATDALFIERISRDLTPAIDAFERAFGAEEAIAFLEDAPLPALALQVLIGLPKEVVGVNPEGGLGLYRTATFDGAVGVVAVTDAAAAQASLATWFEELGAAPERAADGSVKVRMPDGQQIQSFVRGEFLYLVMPELAVPGLPSALAADPEGLNTAPKEAGDPLRALPSPREGLRQNGLYAELREKTKPGHVYLYMHRPFEEELEVQAGLVSFLASDEEVRIDGAMKAPDLAWARSGKAAASPAALASVAAGPVVVVGADLAPQTLQALLFGPPETERRAEMSRMLSALKLVPNEAMDALDGRGTLLFYLDAASLARSVREGVELPVGGFDLRMGLAKQDGIARQKAKNGSKWRATLDGDPAELRLSARELQLVYGSAAHKSRPSVNLVSELREEFGAQAFGPGHLTLFIDVEQLRQELASPQPPGVAQLMAAPFAQFFGMEHIFIDVFGDDALLRIQGEVRFDVLEERRL